MPSLYETDFHEWAVRTAEQIRSGQVPPEELEYIAEELEGLSASDRRELENRLKVLIRHLLKCALREGRPTASWENTIHNQRYSIGVLLKQSPSLAGFVDEFLESAYPVARRLAATDMKVSREAIPEQIPFTTDQILDPEFFPRDL